MTASPRLHNLLAACSLIGLIFLCLAWELWWAPLRPGGSWLVLKALPLLAPLRGILHGRRYTHRWTTLLALLYFTEGVVRGMTEPGLAGLLAMLEACLAASLFVGAAGYARDARP